MRKSWRFNILEGMTMRCLMWSALAVGLVFTGQSVSQANDTIRLGGPSVLSDIQGDTDTELIRYYGGRGYYGGGRGYYGGHGHYGHGNYGYNRGYGNYYGGYNRGYGSYYGGYNRGYYGGYYGGYGRSYYGGYYGGYRPYYGYGSYYGGYAQPYYSNYGSYSNYGYYGISGTGAPLLTAQVPAEYYPYQAQSQVPQNYTQPYMPPASNGTYPYDGGPSSPIPMPADSAVPTNNGPRGTVPLDGKLVSLPRETTGAAGSVAVPTMVRLNQVATSAPIRPASTRIAYPAYGDERIAPAARR